MNLTLATRIFLGYAIVTLTFGAVSIYSVVQLHSIGREIRLVSDGYLPLTKAVAQIESFHKNRQRDTERLLDEREPETQRALIKLARVYFPQLMREKLAAASSIADETRGRALASERPFLEGLVARQEELSKLYEDYEQACNKLFSVIETSGGAVRGSEPVRAVVALEKRIDREIKVLGLMLDQRVAERVGAAERRERRSAWAIIALSLFAIALGLAATAMAGRLLAPIRTLTGAVTRIGLGDYSAEVPLSAKDEIGVLAREFNAMAKALRERERQLEEKQEALVRAERLAAIGRISAQITHEIRNPLTSIGLNTELLEEAIDEGSASGESRQLVKAIGHEVDRLVEITEQYLKFARFPKPVLEPADPNAIIEAVLEFHEEELARAGVRVERALAPNCPLVTCDQGQVRQVLVNLLRNSREALLHGGTIRVETRPLVTQVEVTIADDGPGIPPEGLAHIFDPFFSTKDRGTGLGLALTQQIIAEHGGEIRCESELGRGTRFHIRLRRAATALEPRTA
ncbi:MAG: ATP-binding protein [Myxococcales bacterium]|jgi:two-component system NtrC family sensor kinase